MVNFKFPKSKKSKKDIGFPKHETVTGFEPKKKGIESTLSREMNTTPPLQTVSENRNQERFTIAQKQGQNVFGITQDERNAKINRLIHPSLQDLSENQLGILREIERETDFRPVKITDYSENDQKDITTLSRLGFIRIKGDELQPAFIRKPEDVTRD